MNNEGVREIDRKKKYLKRYKKNLELIKRLNQKLEVLNARIYGVRSQALNGMPRGGEPVQIADLISDKKELEDRIDRLTERGLIYKAEILERIDSLDDTRYAEILEAFFIDCKDFDIIAKDTGYTLRHVIRLYSEGVGALSLECH